MAAVADGVLVYASDPVPTAGELVFDFVAGQFVWATAQPANLVTATADAALGAATVDAAGTTSEPTPEPPVDTPHEASLPMPRLSNVGRIVSLKLTADLGNLTAHLAARIELADEELIELL